MKKKKNKLEESADSGEIFPVDTLGIPILVEVVQTNTATADAGETAESPAEAHTAEQQESAPQPIPDRHFSAKLAIDPGLERITDNIVQSVTAEVTALLEPLVRSKVNLVLQQYQDELLKLVKREDGERPA